MTKLTTKKASRTHRVLIFGPPKTGKSQLAGKLSEFYNLTWVDMENGHEVLFKLPEEWQERIDLINLPDTRDFPIAIETCLKMIRGPVDICDKHGKVKCMVCTREAPEEFSHVDLKSFTSEDVVVFDSLTQLSNSAIAHITKEMPDDYKVDWDDWGNLGKLLDIFLSALQQAHYNVIVISHEVEAEREDGKKTIVPVGGTRNFSRNIAKYFDHVIYAEKKNCKHKFASSTTYANNILTGSRTDIVMENSDEPSLLAIFKPEIYADRSKAEKTTHVDTVKTEGILGTKPGSILDRIKQKGKQ